MTNPVHSGEPFSYLFGRMWQFCRGRHGRVVIYISASIIANLILLLEPLLFGIILNEIQSNGITNENISRLVLLASGFLAITFLFWCFHGLSRVAERKNAFLVRQAYKEYLLEKILSLRLSWHADRDSGSTIDKVEKGSQALYEFTDGVFIFVEIFVRFFGTAIVHLYFNVYAGLALFFITSLTFVVLGIFNRRLITQFTALNLFDNTISAKIFDALSNITSIIILRIKEPILSSLQSSIRTPFGLYTKNVHTDEVKWFTGSLLFELSLIVPLIIFIYAQLGTQATIEVGTVSALYIYLRNMGNVFFSFAYHYEHLLRQRADVANAELLEQTFADSVAANRNKRQLKQTLALHNVSFSYQTDQRLPQLQDVSVTVTTGERIALIGESGSGKTTFLKILHGLHDISSGEIAIDGVSLRKSLSEIDLNSTLVPQEPELFSASIEENITLGMSATAKDLSRVLELSTFASVLEDLPQGLASKINEKGVNLSGGQKQRLALARALFFARKKSLILLDESTSSVDPHNERTIYEGIFKEFNDKTIIASIHKLNLLDLFDRIIVFKKGRIVADGSLSSLQKTDPTFKALWDSFASQK